MTLKAIQGRSGVNQTNLRLEMAGGVSLAAVKRKPDKTLKLHIDSIYVA